MIDPRKETLLKEWVTDNNIDRRVYEIHAGKYNKYMGLDRDKRLYEYLLLPSVIYRKEIYGEYTTIKYLSLSWFNFGICLRIEKTMSKSYKGLLQ